MLKGTQYLDGYFELPFLADGEAVHAAADGTDAIVVETGRRPRVVRPTGRPRHEPDRTIAVEDDGRVDRAIRAECTGRFEAYGLYEQTGDERLRTVM